MSDPFVLSADIILPMDPVAPPLLRHAGLVITADRITDLGDLSELRSRFGKLSHQHHAGILLPGFINAHTHLELSYLSAAALQAQHFTRWVSSLIAAYPPPDRLESVIRAATRKGAAESLRAGVTTLGDISRHAAITRFELLSLARASPIAVPRTVSFGEVVALGKMRDRLPAMLAAAEDLCCGSSIKSKFIHAGLSPHAPYTVEGPALRQILSRALIKRLPICMHLAELAEETEFLRDLSGPLGRDWELMQKMDILDHAIPLYDGGPIRWAQHWGLLIYDRRQPPARDLPVLLAHVNYCANAELAQLASSRASIAYCPRTHAYFNHPRHRYRDMLDHGINVCLATDSLASNPDLSVLKEAQFVYQREHAAPRLAGITDPLLFLDMITRRPAIALGLDKNVGSLTPRKFADLVLLPLPAAASDTTTALAHAILMQAPNPSALWLAGQRLY